LLYLRKQQQVPSSFNPQQRRAIADAATIAGLPVLQIIDEATAGTSTMLHAYFRHCTR
jgi:hypothetical protein